MKKFNPLRPPQSSIKQKFQLILCRCVGVKVHLLRWYYFAYDFEINRFKMINAAPTLITISATLKIAKYLSDMKSTTL
jgi:hypothetical protein